MSTSEQKITIIPPVASEQKITVTESAATKIFNLIQEEENPNVKLRIYVSGGGCSGFQYGFAFTEEVKDDDYVVQKKIETSSFDILVDHMSLLYLEGAIIDYKEDAAGSQFIIKNPKASGSCGCGNSFSIE